MIQMSNGSVDISLELTLTWGALECNSESGLNVIRQHIEFGPGAFGNALAVFI